MDVQNAQRRAAIACLGYKQAGDLAIIHIRNGLLGQSAGRNGCRIGGHNFRCGHLTQPLHVAPQVTIGDDACQVALSCGDTDNTEPFLANGDQDL